MSPFVLELSLTDFEAIQIVSALDFRIATLNDLGGEALEARATQLASTRDRVSAAHSAAVMAYVRGDNQTVEGVK